LRQYGSCRCGGRYVLQWGGIVPQYFCNRCGVVINHPGIRNKIIEQAILREAFNTVWNVIGEDEVYAGPFISTVEHAIGGKPIITEEMLNKWGFKISGIKITRRKTS
jgi:hypothetical protein